MRDIEFKKIEGMLYNYKTIKTEIKSLEIEIKYIQNSYEECKAISYEEKSGSTNKFSSVVENEIINKERIIKDLKRRIYTKQMIIDKLDNAISDLSPKCRELINIRYIEGKGEIGWPEVARRLYISEIRCYQLKKEIIQKMKQVFFVSNYSETIGKL